MLEKKYAWARAKSYTWVKSSITVASLMHSRCLTAEWLFWVNCALMHALKEMKKFWMNKQSARRRDSSGYSYSYSYSELPVFVTRGRRRTWNFYRTRIQLVIPSQALPHSMDKSSPWINNPREMVTEDCTNDSSHKNLVTISWHIPFH